MVEEHVVRGVKVLVSPLALAFDQPQQRIVGSIKISYTAMLNRDRVACVSHELDGAPVVRWYRLKHLTVVRS